MLPLECERLFDAQATRRERRQQWTAPSCEERLRTVGGIEQARKLLGLDPAASRSGRLETSTSTERRVRRDQVLVDCGIEDLREPGQRLVDRVA